MASPATAGVVTETECVAITVMSWNHKLATFSEATEANVVMSIRPSIYIRQEEVSEMSPAAPKFAQHCDAKNRSESEIYVHPVLKKGLRISYLANQFKKCDTVELKGGTLEGLTCIQLETTYDVPILVASVNGGSRPIPDETIRDIAKELKGEATKKMAPLVMGRYGNIVEKTFLECGFKIPENPASATQQGESNVKEFGGVLYFDPKSRCRTVETVYCFAPTAHHWTVAWYKKAKEECGTDGPWLTAIMLVCSHYDPAQIEGVLESLKSAKKKGILNRKKKQKKKTASIDRCQVQCTFRFVSVAYRLTTLLSER